jgi:autotransporter-associated beta strand protein
VTKAGAGTLTLTNASTHTGTTTVTAGTLALGDGGTTGSLAGRIALSNTTALVVNRSNDLTLGEVVSGTGSLTKQGAGTLTLTAANTFVGTTTISAGTISLSGGNNRLATGGTVSFAGNAGLSVSGSQSLSRVTLANDVSAAVGGGGTLALTGASFFIGGSGSNTSQTLDASGLASFSSSNAAGTFKVGGNNGFGVAMGRLVLPANAAITASSIGVGTDPNNAAASSGTLTLGTTTTLFANTITLGAAQSQGTINVAAGTVSPVLTLRAANGTGPVASMTIGTSLTGYGLTTASRVDLTGGTGASTLDAVVTNLVIGQSTRTTNFSGGSLNVTGGLLMQTGTLTATTITLGQTLNNPTFGASGQVISGSLSVSGGTVNATTLYLADQNWTSGTVRGMFALNGGGTLNAGTIASGTGVGSGAAVRTFTWNDGTIANLDASTDLTIGSSISFTLANTGTHRFSIGSGRSGSVASLLAGAGGTLEKTGGGTLVLSANNTYTGATTVSAGTLLVNGNQSAAVGAVTVDLGATLGGSGTIGGAVSILGGGIVAPGTSPGTLTVSESFSLAGGSILSFELDAQNTTVGGGVNDLITGVTGLTLDGVLDITGAGDWTAVADNTAWRLFNYSGALVDNGLTLGSVPTLSAGQSFQIDTATAGQVNIVVVPEPAALALAGLGIAAAAILRRRRK